MNSHNKIIILLLVSTLVAISLVGGYYHSKYRQLVSISSEAEQLIETVPRTTLTHQDEKYTMEGIGDIVIIASSTQGFVYIPKKENDSVVGMYYFASFDDFLLGAKGEKVLVQYPLSRTLPKNKHLSDNSSFGTVVSIHNRLIVIGDTSIVELLPETLQVKVLRKTKNNELFGQLKLNGFDGGYWTERLYEVKGNTLNVKVYSNKEADPVYLRGEAIEL